MPWVRTPAQSSLLLSLHIFHYVAKRESKNTHSRNTFNSNELENYENRMFSQTFQNPFFLICNFSGHLWLWTKSNNSYFKVALSSYKNMDSYSLQLENWLSSSVAQTQNLTTFGIKQLIDLKQKVTLLYFLMCVNMILNIKMKVFHLELNILFFKFSAFQDSLTQSISCLFFHK